MSGILGTIRRWFSRAEEDAKEVAEGGIAVATPEGEEREESTNAQVAGAYDEPYPGNE